MQPRMRARILVTMFFSANMAQHTGDKRVQVSRVVHAAMTADRCFEVSMVCRALVVRLNRLLLGHTRARVAAIRFRMAAPRHHATTKTNI